MATSWKSWGSLRLAIAWLFPFQFPCQSFNFLLPWDDLVACSWCLKVLKAWPSHRSPKHGAVELSDCSRWWSSTEGHSRGEGRETSQPLLVFSSSHNTLGDDHGLLSYGAYQLRKHVHGKVSRLSCLFLRYLPKAGQRESCFNLCSWSSEPSAWDLYKKRSVSSVSISFSSSASSISLLFYIPASPISSTSQLFPPITSFTFIF